MKETLPCPFCGHDLTVKKFHTKTYDGWIVECAKTYKECGVVWYVLADTRQEAINVANKRG